MNEDAASLTGEGCRNIALVISYDGTEYQGWQRQSSAIHNGRTVQGEIEAALAKLHKHPVALMGSSRTDAGVHAAGQAANFYTDIANMEARRFVPALNGFLPGAIRVLDSREVPHGFHARFDAKARLYRYFFVCGREALPSEKLYTLTLRRAPDIALLNSYARLFRGETDCSFFAAADDSSRSKHRYIYHAVFYMEGGKLVFDIRANAFLRKMIRLLAGTMLFYGEKRALPEEFSRVAVSGRRELAGPALPPQGLFLWKVEY